MYHFSALSLLGLMVGLVPAAHAQQPFERFGIKVKVATLSNGRYPEFFHNDSLRRIGSVVYNTRLHQIAYLLPADSLVGRARPEVTSRWFSPDPLAEKYMYITPYAFGNNNPVRYSDVDGREIVDAHNNHVSITYNKNGSVNSISPNATADDRRVISALNLTSTGRMQLHSADGSDIQVAFYIVPGAAPHGKNNSVLLGSTTPPDAAYSGKNGKSIKVYTGAVAEARSKGSLKGLTTEQAIGAVVGHEIVHGTDKQEIAKDLQNPARQDRETKPNQVEQKIVNESKKLQ